MGSLVTGLTLSYDVAANWKVLAENYNECYHCGPVHPELVRLVPAFGGGGTDLAWEDGIPHREGAWTFTMSGTTNRAPLPGLSEAEKVRHKGELVYPNLMLSCSADHVAAFVLRPVAVDRTRIECSLLFARGRRRGRRLRPLRRRRLLGPGQQAGLGDLRVRAARDVVAGLHARLVRPDGGRQRGHPALAAAQAGRRRWLTGTTSSSSAWAPSAARPPCTWRAVASACSGSSGSSSGTSAVPRTTPAGSCGTATTPRATSG